MMLMIKLHTCCFYKHKVYKYVKAESFQNTKNELSIINEAYLRRK